VGGRGLSVPVSLVYDSKGWVEHTANPSLDTPVYVAQGIFDPQLPNGSLYHNMAWSVAGPLTVAAVPWRGGSGTGYGLFSHTQLTGCPGGGSTYTYSTTFREPSGTSHSFPSFTVAPCPSYSTTTYIPSTDGAGFTLAVNSTGPIAVYGKDGTHLYHTLDQSGNETSLVMEDTNGNKITRAVVSNVPASTITDTLGRSLNEIPVLNSSTGKYELKYYDSTGSQQTIQITTTAVNYHTHLCPLQLTLSQGPCYEAIGSWQAPVLFNCLMAAIYHRLRAERSWSDFIYPASNRGFDLVHVGTTRQCWTPSYFPHCDFRRSVSNLDLHLLGRFWGHPDLYSNGGRSCWK